MTLFKHSYFLYYLMLSFAVSTVSPKKSSSFNMFSTSTIAFIRCLNRHEMRNNIRYKGNINNTSVIIFLIGALDGICKLNKNSQRWYLLGRTYSEVFVMLVAVLHSLLFLWCWLLFFIHCCFCDAGCCSLFITFRRHPSPFCELSPGFYTHFIFLAQLIAGRFTTLSSQPFRALLLQFYLEHYGFERAFFTRRRFLPYILSHIFDTTCFYQGLPGSP